MIISKKDETTDDEMTDFLIFTFYLEYYIHHRELLRINSTSYYYTVVCTIRMIDYIIFCWKEKYSLPNKTD